MFLEVGGGCNGRVVIHALYYIMHTDRILSAIPLVT